MAAAPAPSAALALAASPAPAREAYPPTEAPTRRYRRISAHPSPTPSSALPAEDPSRIEPVAPPQQEAATLVDEVAAESTFFQEAPRDSLEPPRQALTSVRPASVELGSHAVRSRGRVVLARALFVGLLSVVLVLLVCEASAAWSNFFTPTSGARLG